MKKTLLTPTLNHQEKVIVSLTTTPLRIQKIWPTINSILLQSTQAEKIHLWIAKEYKRFPGIQITQLPNFIKDNPYIHVEFIENDFGPASKLLPCLQSPELNDTKIVVIDDDAIYPPNLIKDLLTYEAFDPNTAIGIAGTIIFGSYKKKYRRVWSITNVDILLGCQGYLVKPRFFSQEVFEYPPNLPEAFFEDDVWLSGHLWKNNIRRVLIPSQNSRQNIFLLSNKKFKSLCQHENIGQKNFTTVFNYFCNLINLR
jgi:hypothetical protein